MANIARVQPDHQLDDKDIEFEHQRSQTA